ncbi:MAG: hypothetical protein ACQESE_01190 [Nanobdellota archaeon]
MRGKKAQHEMDLTSLAAGLVFIIIAFIIFSQVADNIRMSSEERTLQEEMELGVSRHLRTLLESPADYQGSKVKVSELIQDYYYYYLQQEEDVCEIHSCSDHMILIKKSIQESVDHSSRLLEGNKDINTYLMKADDPEITLGEVTYDVDPHSRSCSRNDDESYYCVGGTVFSSDAVFLPLRTHESLSGYDEYVIVFVFGLYDVEAQASYSKIV